MRLKQGVLKFKIMNKKTIIIFFLLFIPLSFLMSGKVCVDGWASPSIGSSGACSHHGGVSSFPGIFVFFISLLGTFYVNKLLNKKNKDETLKEEKTNENLTPKENISKGIEEEKTNENLTPKENISKGIEEEKKKRVRCPRCRSYMVIRTVKKGKNIGSKFYGCTKYPRCRGTRFVPKGDD